MSDEQEGGSEWELAEAIKLMGDAQASADPAQIATAMRRHAEALTNATNTTMIPTLKNVLETVVRKEVGALARRIDATVQVQDQRFGYILNQFGAFLEKEDERHRVYDKSEETTQAALASAARMLDQITSYVQQSLTQSREANDRSRRSEANANESLAVSRESLAVSRAGAVELAKLKKVVVVLEKGQAASKKQWREVLNLLADSKTDRADLRQRISALAIVVEEHNRFSVAQEQLAKDVAELKAWKAELEARSDGNA